MKKIAFVIPDLNAGGMARCLETLSRGLDKTKYEQMIICLKEKKINYDVRGNVISIAPEGKNWLTKGLVFIVRWWRLRKLFQHHTFGVVITYGMTANCLVAMAKDSRCRQIMTEHSVKSIENHVSKAWMKKLANFVYDSMMKKLYNRAERVVTVSRYMGYDLVRNYHVCPDKIYNIYNGSDITRINMLGREKLPAGEEKLFQHPVVISVGALCAHKGQWHLLRIMPKVLEVIPDAQLVLLGKGPGRQELELLRQKLGLENCVHILGQKKNPYTYMAHADVFVLSSFFEGFPNVLIEAIALGVPVVSVDCKSGPRELLQPGSDILSDAQEIEIGKFGILTPAFTSYVITDALNAKDVGAENALQNAIIEMLTNTTLAQHFILEYKNLANRFSAQNMVAQFEKIIDNPRDFG